MSINDCEIIEKFYRKDRWYVKLSSSFNGRATMPHANYVWLKGNPAFVGIPNGYVVHHLDCDKLNDDISNLVIMQKHHHVAHHWKQNKINPDIKVNVEYQRFERTIYVPISEPKIKFDKTRNCYCLLFREESSGEIKRKYLSKLEGKKFSSIEDAEAAKQKIWPPKK